LELLASPVAYHGAAGDEMEERCQVHTENALVMRAMLDLFTTLTVFCDSPMFLHDLTSASAAGLFFFCHLRTAKCTSNKVKQVCLLRASLLLYLHS